MFFGLGLVIIGVGLAVATFVVAWGFRDDNYLAFACSFVVGICTLFVVVIGADLYFSIDNRIAEAIATQGGLRMLSLSANDSPPKLANNERRAFYAVCNERTGEAAIALVTSDGKDDNVPARYLYVIKGTTCGAADVANATK